MRVVNHDVSESLGRIEIFKPREAAGALVRCKAAIIILERKNYIHCVENSVCIQRLANLFRWQVPEEKSGFDALGCAVGDWPAVITGREGPCALAYMAVPLALSQQSCVPFADTQKIHP